MLTQGAVTCVCSEIFFGRVTVIYYNCNVFSLMVFINSVPYYPECFLYTLCYNNNNKMFLFCCLICFVMLTENIYDNICNKTNFFIGTWL